MNQPADNVTPGSVSENSQTLTEPISIEITTTCNCACTHCFARADRKERHSLDSTLIAQIITEGYRAGYRALHFTGGEPLVRADLETHINTAFSMGYTSVFFNTNGILLTPARCATLSSFGNKLSLSVSIQGDEALHDAIRGKGNYARAITGITNALDAGITVHVFTPVGRTLLPDLAVFTDVLTKKFAGRMDITLIQLIRVHNDAFDLSYDLLSPFEFITLIRTVSLLSLAGYKISILENPLAGVVADILSMKHFPSPLPLIRPGRLVIMADGTITLAHSIRASIGQYTQGIIPEILASDEYRKATAENDSRCLACNHHAVCRKNGMVRPSEPIRDMIQEIPYCKRTLDILSEDNSAAATE